MSNDKQQPKTENLNNQFSNTEPLTHAQRVAIANTMSNNKQSSVEWLQAIELERDLTLADWNKAKAMQQEQAQLYATFVLRCVQNNLPPITFNDWINLDNNEQ